jgi:hypothetical protein
MISSEVQRTLVKSPPELWAELSDPTALARHLGELGEIRILRTEPESTIEWAAENTTGTVSIKPSGWGTKVTLSVTRKLVGQATPAPTALLDAGSAEESSTEASAVSHPEPDTATSPDTATNPATATSPATAISPTTATSPDTATNPETATNPATATNPDTATNPAIAAETEPAIIAEPAPAEPVVEPEERRGFFARLFSRRRAPTPVTSPTPVTPPALASTGAVDHAPASIAAAEQVTASERVPGEPDAFAAVRHVLAPETFAAAHPFAALADIKPTPETQAAEQAEQGQGSDESHSGQPGDEHHPGQPGDISAELMAAEEVTAEEVTAEEVTAVLTAVLDRLGAAHHRPFSRA